MNLDGRSGRNVLVAALILFLSHPAQAQQPWTIVRDRLAEGGACPADLPESAPDYPIASIRTREEGRVVVGLCVDADGKPLRFEVLQRSDATRLDIATVLWSCGRKYSAAIDSRGTAQPTCAAVSEFTWRLNDFPRAQRLLEGEPAVLPVTTAPQAPGDG